ncbi:MULTISPECIES: nucleotidyltransferase family protein [Halolamina]|uniref:CTP:molybdopterin cytidylyltransferase MocA n=1 Tax=Halolamina pelagica TaxID=699431 RepID=A0A1I5QVV2_9EURY|nr:MULTISPECIES: nucleotidyltransferase family protein [Halolamina]NHX35569.1 nucleotidyltransferase family protein [Halolamina sp. R1-12]SFP50424.1 CTP:molybdopterin cytidylyltransferase MocA [Halolamina pelagica]
MSEPALLGLITAAGKSTRMGGFPKPLLTVDRQRFVERLIEQYREAGVDDVVVVLGYEADEVRSRADLSGARVVENERYEEGMLSSVRAGVREAQALDADGLLLSPVDYPVIPAAVIRTVVGAFAADRTADVIQPTTDGERGHPPLFAASTFDALLHDPATEEEGARAVVYADQTDTREVPVDDARIFVDVDTPAAYWEAVKKYT